MKKITGFLQKIWDRFFNRKKMLRFERNQIKFHKLYPEFQIGANTYGVPIVRQWDKKSQLRIGAYCSIAKNVQIFLGGNHRTDWITTYPFPEFYPEKNHILDYSVGRGDVVIGSDVWICQDSTILSGIHIGHGAVIANGSVVTKDVEPYSIVAGVPARHVRWRFDEHLRSALLTSAWWEWPTDEVHRLIDLLCSDDVDGFLRYVHERHNKNAV